MTEISVLVPERTAPRQGAALPSDADIAVPSQPLSKRARTWTLWLLVIALLVWSWAPAEMDRVTALFTDWRNMAEFGRGFLKPDFHEWRAYFADMVVTVQIALWAPARPPGPAGRLPSLPRPTTRRGGWLLRG